MDLETLESTNLYRHALGISYVGPTQSRRHARLLDFRYPHIDVQARVGDILGVLTEEPDFIMTADLIVLALGDEILELRLDDLLRNQKLRMHVWVEPIGLGGHVLAVGLGNSSGCFRCLFHQAHQFKIF